MTEHAKLTPEQIAEIRERWAIIVQAAEDAGSAVNKLMAHDCYDDIAALLTHDAALEAELAAARAEIARLRYDGEILTWTLRLVIQAAEQLRDLTEPMIDRTNDVHREHVTAAAGVMYRNAEGERVLRRHGIEAQEAE